MQAETFTLSSPSKISPDPNRAIGFPPGLSCPFATKQCSEDCYAKKGRFIFKGPKGVLERNWMLLLYLFRVNNIEECVALLLNVIPYQARCFRFLEAGDIPSGNLGNFLIEAFIRVAKARPKTRFWMYTRTVSKLEKLLSHSEVNNLTVWFSVDKTTPKEHVEIAHNLGARIAYGPWLKDDDIPSNTVVCPGTIKVKGNYYEEYTNKSGAKRLKLIPGSCERCGYCWKGRARKSVLFWRH